MARNIYQVLETLNERFIDALDAHLFIYKMIGSSTSESPMWMQLDTVKEDDFHLTFINSQRSSISFTVPADDDTLQWIDAYRDVSYDYFKYLKYTHIRDNHSTVWEELTSGHNGTRINNFLESYKTVA